MAQAGVIRDFMVALGFKTDNSGLEKMQGAMKGVELKAASLNAALMALATGAVIAVRQTASELDKLYFSSQRIGASATNITAFGNAISQMGGDAESALGTLENLAEKMRNSPGYDGMLNNLGVNTKNANGEMRDRVEVMKDLSGVLAKMPAYQANAYANSLGIDQNTLLAMRDGKFISNMDKYQKIQKELGMNDDLTKSGNEFMTEYRDLTMITKTGFQVIVMQAGKALIPVLRLLNQLIQSGIHAFSQLNPQIKQGLAVGLRFAMLALMFGAFIKVFAAIARFLPILKSFIGLLKLLNLAFLASPIGIILALAAALGALYDDYKTWREGGKSLFDWSKWTNGIESIIQKIKDFLDILDKVKDKAVEFVQKIVTNPAEAFSELTDEAKKQTQDVADAAKQKAIQVVEGANKAAEKISEKAANIAKKATEVVVGTAKSVVGAVKGTVVSKASLDSKSGRRLSVYNAFLKAGFSKNQAMALTAEVGRENEYSMDTMFGTHSDAGNAKQNLGFFSWQGARKQELIEHLKSKNLLDKSGHMLKKQESLDAMAEFSRKEIYSVKRYSKTKDLFEASPNANPEDYAKTLGKNYIVWAYGQDYINKGKTKFDWKAHDQRRRKNLIALEGDSKSNGNNTTPKGSKDLANFAQNAEMPNIQTYAPSNGNPHKSQVNNSQQLSASNVVIHQSFKTDMTLNGVSSPVDAANAVKRQHENDLVFMARGVKGSLV